MGFNQNTLADGRILDLRVSIKEGTDPQLVTLALSNRAATDGNATGIPVFVDMTPSSRGRTAMRPGVFRACESSGTPAGLRPSIPVNRVAGKNIGLSLQR